ncbi:MAG: DUF2383 domain-containing protein [Firmicutes bacterium]|nr:DUF2383 domain-containing protein [Bacillota bacterium]
MSDASKREVIKALNAFLKGEHMAIRSYDEFVHNVQDHSIKKELARIQQEHKQHAADIARRIQELGGKPQESTGLAGIMAWAMMEVAEITGQTDLDIVKRALEGEDLGIKSAAKVVEGDLDPVSEKLVRQILSADQAHLGALRELINTYENSICCDGSN